MSLRDGINNFMIGIRKGPAIAVSDANHTMISIADLTSGKIAVVRDAPDKVRVISQQTLASMEQNKGQNIQIIPGLGELKVIDTSQPPSPANVPGSWSRAWMGPGQPFTPIDAGSRSKDAETEPRSFQYLPQANAMFTPRMGWGPEVLPFSMLRMYAESVPEVAMCEFLLVEEMKSFVPQIVDMAGNPVQEAETAWMTTYPDGDVPWADWLSVFLSNTLEYDAAAVYNVRGDNNKVVGARVIDGSTIFLLIDEIGNTPRPPAPAFTQVLWGVPKMFLNKHQLWYHPRHRRTDAPYGKTPVERSLPAVQLLANLWNFERSKYKTGNIPQVLLTAPPDMKTTEEIFAFQDQFNSTLVGSDEERAARLHFVPAGCTQITLPEIVFNDSSYQAATNSVRLAFGIPQSEVGEAPAGGLGGTGYGEAMQSAFYRMGLKPLITYVEGLFNEILATNGVTDRQFKLAFPKESIDPEKEKDKSVEIFTAGISTRDEARRPFNLAALGGDEGKFIVTPGQGAQDEDTGGGSPFGAAPAGSAGKIKVNPSTPSMPEKVGVVKADFVESEHPRKENGKFGAGGGGQPTARPKWAGEKTVTKDGIDVHTGRFAAKDRWAVSLDDGGPGPFEDTPEKAIESYKNLMASGGQNEAAYKKHAETLDHIKTGKATDDDIAALTHGHPSMTDAAVIGTARELGLRDKDARLLLSGMHDAGLTAGGTTLRNPHEFIEHVQRYLTKSTGVSPSDDAYFGAPIFAPVETEMPRQGADETYVVTVKPGNQPAVPAVWKPESGEDAGLAASVGGKLYPRAEAVYLIDRELAPDDQHYLVPVTFTGEVNGEPGSVQIYVKGAEELKERRSVDDYLPDWVEMAAALDYVTGQLDRDGRNWLTHPDDKYRPILIDNDVCLSHDARSPRSSFVWAMKDKPISEGVKLSLFLLLGNQALWADVAGLLDDPAAVDNARARTQELNGLNLWPAVEMPEPKVMPGKILVKADWQEDKHPRADNGEFGAGSGGGGTATPPAKPKLSPFEPAGTKHKNPFPEMNHLSEIAQDQGQSRENRVQAFHDMDIIKNAGQTNYKGGGTIKDVIDNIVDSGCDTIEHKGPNAYLVNSKTGDRFQIIDKLSRDYADWKINRAEKKPTKETIPSDEQVHDPKDLADVAPKETASLTHFQARKQGYTWTRTRGVYSRDENDFSISRDYSATKSKITGNIRRGNGGKFIGSVLDNYAGNWPMEEQEFGTLAEAIDAVDREGIKAEAERYGNPMAKALFTESEHPRADNGEFGNKGGSGASEIWNTPQQAISSAATSINASKTASVFNTVKWGRGTVNADIGGGRFDNATELLAANGVENIIYDPYNRTAEHNQSAVKRISGGKSDTATVANVLNVVKEPSARSAIIRQAADAIKPEGKAYFQIYEGNKSGTGTPTKAGWQENRDAASYEKEIAEYFGSTERHGNIITATKPKKNDTPKPEDKPVEAKPA